MAKKSKLAGKKVQEEIALGGGLTMVKFTDGTFIIVSNLSDVIEAEELGFEGSASEAEEDEDEGEEEDEDGEEEAEEEDDEEDLDDEEEDEDLDDEEEDEDLDEEDDITAEDLIGMDFDELEDLVDEEELEVDVDDFEDDEDGLRAAIAEELDIELPLDKKGKKKKGKKK